MLLVVDVAIKGLVVLAAAAITAHLLRRGAAASRYLVWSTALSALLALPLLAALLPAWQAPLLPALPESWLAMDSMPTKPVADTSKEQDERTGIAPLPRPAPRAPGMVPLAGPATDGSRSRRRATRSATDVTSSSSVVDEQHTAVQAGGGPPKSNVGGVSLTLSTAAANETKQRDETKTDIPASEAETQASPSLRRATVPASAVPTWPALLAGFYLCGVVALLLHVAAGAAGVLRLVRRAQPVPDGPLWRDFEQALATLGIERDVRLLQSDRTGIPLAWELLRPAVLMPHDAHRWPRERRRVALLHELSHIRRRDCQMQLLAQVALALHWLNPLAWLAVRRLRLEREHACDDAVLGLGIRASDYAEHLLQIARALLPAREPAWASLAMARSTQLHGRVEAILDPLNPRRLPGRRTTMTALLTTFALLLPLAALQPGVAAQAAGTPVPQQAEAPLPPIGMSLPAGEAPLPPIGMSLPTGEAPLPPVGTPLAESAAPLPSIGTPMPGALPQDGRPSVDDLVQMRIHGVTTEFVEEVRAAFGRPVTVRELVQMRIHGTTPEFVRGVQEAFAGDDISIRDVTNLRIHGTTIEYIRAMRDALGGELTVRDITNLRIHGATPEFARAMVDMLGDDVDARDIANLRIHGTSEEFVRDMRALLEDEDLGVRDITSMRIHGVTVELVRDLQEDGFENLTADDLVKMKIHGFDRWLQRRRGGR